MSVSEMFASHSHHAGTCKRQINPVDGQWDKSCVSKGILCVTYSNKQNPRLLFPLSVVGSELFFFFFSYLRFDWHITPLSSLTNDFQHFLPLHFFCLAPPRTDAKGNTTVWHHWLLWQEWSAGDLMAFVNACVFYFTCCSSARHWLSWNNNAWL